MRSITEIGMLVRGERKKLGWTQEKLATEVGVAKLWISQLERGKNTAQIGLVLRTLSALNITISLAPPGATPAPTMREPDNAVDLDALIDSTIKTRIR